MHVLPGGEPGQTPGCGEIMSLSWIGIASAYMCASWSMHIYKTYQTHFYQITVSYTYIKYAQIDKCAKIMFLYEKGMY